MATPQRVGLASLHFISLHGIANANAEANKLCQQQLNQVPEL